jgi:hypothetical protein
MDYLYLKTSVNEIFRNRGVVGILDEEIYRLVASDLAEKFKGLDITPADILYLDSDGVFVLVMNKHNQICFTDYFPPD